jgi:DNA repair exonuclease SbcCD ATPase subunit
MKILKNYKIKKKQYEEDTNKTDGITDEELVLLNEQKNQYEKNIKILEEILKNEKNKLINVETELNLHSVQTLAKIVKFNVRCKTCKENKETLTITELSKIKYDEAVERLAELNRIINDGEEELQNNKNMLIITYQKIQFLKEKEQLVEDLKQKYAKNMYEIICHKIKEYKLYIENVEMLKMINSKKKKIENMLSFEEIEKLIENVNMYETCVKKIKIVEGEILKIEQVMVNLENCKNTIFMKLGGISTQETMLKDINNLIEKEIKNIELSEKIVTIFNDYKVMRILIMQELNKLKENMNNMLVTIVNYTVDLEYDEKNEKVIIYKVGKNIEGKNEKINVATLSGSQTFLISLSLKVCLNKIGCAYKTNILMIDENFNSVDMDKISNLGVLLSIVKQEYDNVVIITHDAEIKINANIKLHIQRNAQTQHVEFVYDYK